MKNATSLSEPLLVASEDHDTDITKSLKPAQQLRVRRLLSFAIGTVTGILLQAISVLFFAKLIMFAHINGQHFLQKTTDMESGVNHYELLLQSSNNPWLKVGIWAVYHMSLFIYLTIWVTMMLLAVSKNGWRCVSNGLRIPHHVTRRACFLRTFFFINGFVQGSLLPWVALEFYVGNPSFDVYWMPTTHMLVFFAVVHVYDWLHDIPTAPKESKDNDQENEQNDEPDLLV